LAASCAACATHGWTARLDGEVTTLEDEKALVEQILAENEVP